MGRGRARWGTKTLRDVMPLKTETHRAPRSDGAYLSEQDPASVSFFEDGTGSIGEEAARWSTGQGLVRVVSESWDCEGTVGLDAVFLLCSPSGDNRQRTQLELRFSEKQR